MGTRASSPDARWKPLPERAELLAPLRRGRRLVVGLDVRLRVAATPAEAPEARCCHFAVTGREPYPTAVELEEVRHAMRASAVDAARSARAAPGGRAPLPAALGHGPLPHLRVAPAGCRTFFCDDAEGPRSAAKAKLPREALNALGRRIADLSARFAPRDPHPRPLVRAQGAPPVS